MLAPRAGDALLQLGRIPWQVHVDHRVGRLQVEPDTARLGREEQPALRILAEAVDLGTTPDLRNGAGVPGELDAGGHGAFAHQLQHPHPLGEDQYLTLRIAEQIRQQALDLVQLGALVAFAVENGGGIADHAHARQELLQQLEFLLGERPGLRTRREAPRPELEVLVHGELGVRHGNEEGLRHPARELALHLLSAPPQHHRGDPIGELLEIPVADRPALGVQLVVLPVEAEQRTEQLGI